MAGNFWNLAGIGLLMLLKSQKVRADLQLACLLKLILPLAFPTRGHISHKRSRIDVRPWGCK